MTKIFVFEIESCIVTFIDLKNTLMTIQRFIIKVLKCQNIQVGHSYTYWKWTNCEKAHKIQKHFKIANIKMDEEVIRQQVDPVTEEEKTIHQ